MFLKYIIALGICLFLWTGNAQAAFPIVTDSTQQTAIISTTTTHAAVSHAHTYWPEQCDRRGRWARTCGIVGIFYPFPFAILAVILGSRDRLNQRCAKTGFTMGVVECILLVLGAILFWLIYSTGFFNLLLLGK